MRRIGHIAVREFLATVATRGFVVGLLIMPATIAAVFALTPRLMYQRGTTVRGQVAVVDPTGQVLPELRATIAPPAVAARRADAARRVLAASPAPVREVAEGAGAAATNAAIASTVAAVPELTVVERPAAADVQAEKAWLVEPARDARHIAVIVVHHDAVDVGQGRAEFGGYDLYVPANLDDRIETVIYDSVREAIVNARMRAAGLDRRRVDALLRVRRAPSITVTKGNERATVGAFNAALPFVFVGLLLFAVLMGGQGLVTSTVEEKSSRVIEVLLSAVSPFELLAGKILGQMGVSLVALALYIVLGLIMLASFALLGLLDFSLIVYLVVFFAITYLTIGSLMVAVGAAVNEMREAQSLMMPIILVNMVPWLLAAPIARDPNSTLSTALSFIPPMNTFAMLLRLTSTAPPPAWQAWLTMAIGLAGTWAAVWFAAKVFRIGLLMHGKPPDLATLLRWAKAA